MDVGLSFIANTGDAWQSRFHRKRRNLRNFSLTSGNYVRICGFVGCASMSQTCLDAAGGRQKETVLAMTKSE
jgi:hypothetical protein